MGIAMAFVGDVQQTVVVGPLARLALSLPGMPESAVWDDRGTCTVSRADLEAFVLQLEQRTLAEVSVHLKYPLPVGIPAGAGLHPAELWNMAQMIRDVLQDPPGVESYTVRVW